MVPRTEMKSLLKNLLLSALIFVLSFVLIEGTSSGLILARGIWTSLRSHDPNFVRYDGELGWSGIPNLYTSYAPGIYLRTNSRGFRSNEETTDQIPPGKVRLLCSGDSFTLGPFVDNDHTWCQLLAATNAELQTVNMGQVAYGVDQMYLWYRRDGISLQHDIHILAVIGDDFRRMELTEMGGAPKPTLNLQNGSLVVGNVPLPPRWRYRYVVWWDLYGQPFKQLRAVQLSEAVLHRIRPPRAPSTGPNAALCQIVSRVFDDLLSINKEKNSIFVVAYLPAEADYYGTDPSLPLWREFLQHEAARAGFLLVDLTEDFQKLSPPELRQLFISPDSPFRTSVGHYTNEGNEFVAKKLYSYLLSQPETHRRLAERRRVAAPPGPPY